MVSEHNDSVLGQFKEIANSLNSKVIGAIVLGEDDGSMQCLYMEAIPLKTIAEALREIADNLDARDRMKKN